MGRKKGMKEQSASFTPEEKDAINQASKRLNGHSAAMWTRLVVLWELKALGLLPATSGDLPPLRRQAHIAADAESSDEDEGYGYGGGIPTVDVLHPEEARL